MNDSRQNSRNGILSLTIKDKAVLYSAYMPFLSNGGLFVPTNKAYDIGDEVFMLLTLMDEPEKIPPVSVCSSVSRTPKPMPKSKITLPGP
jgi:type IV pilus assembly protein PilZ